jgi:hypothetical protein
VIKPESIEFVNRTEELEALRNHVWPYAKRPTVTFLRSPPGYGKTRLTDRLIETVRADGPTCVVVDPGIRSRSRSDRVYAWFFVQRAADPNAVRNAPPRREFRTFAAFSYKSEYAINWKHAYEDLKEAFSLGKIIKLVVGLIENFVKRGRYSPGTLLQDDSSFATQLAQDYVRALATYRPTLFIIRECQNIDPESLRFFLTLGDETSHSFLILEYTSATGQFSEDHEKIIFEAVTRRDCLAIFDLLRLNIREFRLLLRKYVPLDKKIEAAVELAWDGNLRIIKELTYRIMVGRAVEASSNSLLSATLRSNLELLPKRLRLTLAIVAVHVEAITKDTLFAALKLIDEKITANDLALDLARLASAEQYVSLKGGYVSVPDEDLMDALTASPVMLPMLRLAETILRDIYLGILKENAFTNIRLHAALRQAVALCARTGDIVALRGLIRTLDSAVREAYDQTLYINIVAEIILGDKHLSMLERRDLVGWASAAAYEVSDFPTAVSLLETLSERDAYENALLACCYGETNRHNDALVLTRRLITQTTTNSDVSLAAQLIECECLVALGRHAAAEELYAAISDDEILAASPLFGFVLRYAEIIYEFPACTIEMLQSADVLRFSGFRKSAAYSQLAAAVYFAFGGHISTAQHLLEEAEAELLSHVRDRQIILNNTVVVGLLSPSPNLPLYIEKLNSGLFAARDEFSRLVLHNNLLICYWLQGDFVHGIHIAEVMEAILRAPAFGDRGVSPKPP